MKLIIGWFLLIATLIIACLALTVIVYTYLRPQIDVMELYNLTKRTGPVTAYVFFGSLALLFIGAIPWVRRLFLQHRIGLFIGPDPWYVKFSNILAVLAIIVIIITKSAIGIRLEAGKWIVSANYGQVGEEEAIMFLWGNLRVHSAVVFIMAVLWFSFAYTLVANMPAQRDDF